ncbi:MAG: 6-phosphogluconolactonase, partial [Endozoicomonadaceae bacterium]|nr:6-phosphogluconolactonase [Endozoicomonadaceae bacterium]
GIDLFLGGIGSNGHIAFNEPGSDFNSVTRVVNLTSNTIKDNARFFKGDTTQVPTKALSIGIGTYLNSKEVIIMASGKNKAEAIQKAFQQPATEQLPASALQKHSKAFFICDIDSAENSISSL